MDTIDTIIFIAIGLIGFIFWFCAISHAIKLIEDKNIIDGIWAIIFLQFVIILWN